jgi:Tfp pilus assembly protein PilN
MSTEQQVVEEEKASFLKRPIGGGGKTKAQAAPKAGKYGIPPRPQVNLMPPEVIEGRHLVVVKRRLFWGIIALLLVCVLAFAGAYVVRSGAEARYDDALAASDTLTAEKRQYSPVIQVQKDIASTTNARAFALSNEVDWTSYAYAIQSVLPQGVSIESITVAAIGPGDPLTAGADDLTQPGLAIITFSAVVATLPDASEWIEALQSVPGLADANIQSSVLQDQTGEVTYTVAATVQVTEEARANRTFPDATTTSATDDSSDGQG